MSRPRPDVSVIIPLHQAAPTIGETLDSLRQQGALTLEVVVVDDRSSDGGDDLARRHPLVDVVVPSRRAGASGARNTGLAHATGEFVVFLDADDLLLPNALPRRLEVARAHPSCVIATRHVDLVDGEVRPPRARRRLESDTRLMFLGGNQVAIHAATTPRVLLPEPAFADDLRTQEDWALWLRMALAGVRFVFLEVEDCVYRARPGSLSTDTRRRSSETLDMLERARGWIDDSPAGGRARLELRRRQTRHLWLRHRSLQALREGDLTAAAADLVRAVCASPEHCATLPLRGLRRLARSRR